MSVRLQTKMADNHEVLLGNNRTITLQDMNEMLSSVNAEVGQDE